MSLYPQSKNDIARKRAKGMASDRRQERIAKARIERMNNPKIFTQMETAFINNYRGDHKEAAKIAGYKSPAAGANLLRNSDIIEAIKKIGAKHPDIADKEEIMKFHTAIMRNENEKTKDRISSATELGKLEGLYIQQYKVVGEKENLQIEAIRLGVLEALQTGQFKALEAASDMIIDADFTTNIDIIPEGNDENGIT